MFICQEKQFVYVAFTKSGSSSMYNLLNTHFNGTQTKRSWRQIPEQYIDYTSFCIVRNPYSRLVSWWQSICNTGGDRYGHKRELANLGLTESFEDFLTLWKSKNGISQAPFVEEINRMDYILKLENIEEDFNALPFVPVHIDIPRINVREHSPWKKLINKTSGQMIDEMFKRDFELFGYEMETFE